MSNHALPATLDDAKAAGYVKIGNVTAFLRDHLELTEEQFQTRRQNFAATADVDCGTAPPGTPCYRECFEDKHKGIVGFCGPNGTCDLYSGPC